MLCHGNMLVCSVMATCWYALSWQHVGMLWHAGCNAHGNMPTQAAHSINCICCIIHPKPSRQGQHLLHLLRGQHRAGFVCRVPSAECRVPCGVCLRVLSLSFLPHSLHLSPFLLSSHPPSLSPSLAHFLSSSSHFSSRPQCLSRGRELIGARELVVTLSGTLF
jgi:hypothetical protein